MKKEVNKKRKKKNRIIFCLISIGIILLVLGIFIGRFIINKKNVLVDGRLGDYINDKNLVKVNNGKIYRGGNVNNYLVFNNILFRIISVNKDDSLELVTDGFINILSNKKRNVEKYINDKFLRLLDKSYLVETASCKDIIDKDLKISNCKDIEADNYVRLLMISEFMNSVENNESYLYDEDGYWLDNYSNDLAFIGYGSKIVMVYEDEMYKVKPVIRLKSDLKIVSGDGSSDNPYRLEEDKDIKVGSYVKIGNDRWIVYDVFDKSVNLVLSKGISFALEYGNSSTYGNSFGIGKYLNTEYLDSLSYKDIINEKEYSIYKYEDDYKNVDKKKIRTKVGMMSVSDVKINVMNDDFYLLTPVDDEMVYLYGTGKNVSKINYARKVRPTINVNKNKIKSGTGLIDDEYLVEE